MIQINDSDLPIQVAEKIICGSKDVPASTLDKAVYRVFAGKEIGETISRDMFDLEEIKEIADYLIVYYETHTKTEIEAESEDRQEIPKSIVVRPKCKYCEFATLKATDPPCYPCFCKENRPNFKPNEACRDLYSKIKEGMENE